jgi:hypothetical protein
MYSIHAARPKSPHNRPEYYMHQVDVWSTTGNPRSFRAGVAAFEKLRDYAEEQRNDAIQRANERARTIDSDAVGVLDGYLWLLEPSESHLSSLDNESPAEFEVGE